MRAQGGITRLAPSPTGALHLGHAFAFTANWLLARQLGWRVLLRLDDLDAPRVAAGGERGVIDDLRWLGLDWDGAPIRQSARMDRYRHAMNTLAQAGRVFESPHSRAEVREAALAASAPQEGEVHAVFPRSLRPEPGAAWRFTNERVNHRAAVPDGIVRVHDELLGERAFDLAGEHGDFIVWAKAGMPSYQLACAVDDGELGVTDVVRGEDLLGSAAVQQLLLGWLGHAAPRWWHLPLVRDAAGRRLAKRDGDEGLVALRNAGVSPDRIRGLVASWLGLLDTPRPLDMTALLALSAPDRLTHGAHTLASRGGARVTMHAAAWLRGVDAAADTLARDARGTASN